jgi:hypothetical protein
MYLARHAEAAAADRLGRVEDVGRLLAVLAHYREVTRDMPYVAALKHSGLCGSRDSVVY